MVVAVVVVVVGAVVVVVVVVGVVVIGVVGVVVGGSGPQLYNKFNWRISFLESTAPPSLLLGLSFLCIVGFPFLENA